MAAVSPPHSFERIIAPVAVTQFLAEYYEQRILLLQREQPTFYSDLVSVGALDEFLSMGSPHCARVFAVDARRDIVPEEYTLPDGRIDVVRVFQLFADGATIGFPHMHDHVPALASICRGAEQLFNCPFQTNLYFTPANGQGFKTHYDTHDVFVLQVAGSKRWQVYDPVIRLPLPGQVFDSDEHKLGPVVREFMLSAGDIFYCPRGVPHDASATEEPSLHITFGALAYSWAEVMIEAMADACLNDAFFRASLPIGFATNGAEPDALETKFRALVERFSRSARLGPAIDGLREKFITGRSPFIPEQRRHLGTLDTLTIDSWVGGRLGLIYRCCLAGDEVRIHSHANEISMPRHAAEALTFALETPRFQIGELPSSLDDAGKLTLIRRLIREGLVVTFP
jgi:Cupin superfamily protein